MSSHECFTAKAPQEGPPLIQHGTVVFQAHYVGWIVCAFFTIVASVTSFWLIDKHLQWYTNKQEQRYIVRILFMVPIYAVISTASYFFWNHSTPLLLLRDCYESIVLTAFFYLLLTYLSHDPEEQKDILRREGLSHEQACEAIRKGEEPKKWVFPFGSVRWKPQDGLYFLQLMKWGVLQYCVVRPLTTLIAVLLDYVGLYCEDSWSPAWGHIWITGIVSISVSVAMYCLLQFYLSVSKHLTSYKPVLKLFAIKAVVFLTFWQASFLSLLTIFGVVKDTPYMTADDINIGWGAILETFEMTIFAFVHVRAFSYKPYRPDGDTQRTPRLRSLGHAMNFRETFHELKVGCVYMWHRMHGVETDTLARRQAVLESAFGKSRTQFWKAHDLGVHEKEADNAGELEAGIEMDRVVDVEGERQWLGTGDDYAYGLMRREQSGGLEVRVEKELTVRGYSRPDVDAEHDQGHELTRRSWWCSMYYRVSQANPDQDEQRYTDIPKHREWSRRNSRSGHVAQRSVMYEDPPPPSIIRTYRNSRRMSKDAAHMADAPIYAPTQSAYFTDVDGMPVSTADRLVSPSAVAPGAPLHPALVRTDSMFLRVFPHSAPHSDADQTSRSDHTSVVPSSQSHRTRAHLGPSPAVLTKEVKIGHVWDSIPCFTDVNQYAPSLPRFSTSQVGSVHHNPRPGETEINQRRRSSHRRESALHQSIPAVADSYPFEHRIKAEPNHPIRRPVLNHQDIPALHGYLDPAPASSLHGYQPAHRRYRQPQDPVSQRPTHYSNSRDDTHRPERFHRSAQKGSVSGQDTQDRRHSVNEFALPRAAYIYQLPRVSRRAEGRRLSVPSTRAFAYDNPLPVQTAVSHQSAGHPMPG